jgi:predicted 3-demethylubiquinone-9 3-methyltransferase (glyoxalase superfamily)
MNCWKKSRSVRKEPGLALPNVSLNAVYEMEARLSGPILPTSSTMGDVNRTKIYSIGSLWGVRNSIKLCQDSQEKTMQKIIPTLWFETEDEEAMAFYTSNFENSGIKGIERYPEGPLEVPIKGMEGRVLNADFELEGYQFKALDGGPMFKFNPSISFFVNLNKKEEVDQLWEVLSNGGMPMMPLGEYPFSPWYGWIQDKYGLSWQLILNESLVDQKIIPSLLFVGDRAGKAEEAIHFYSDVFEPAKVDSIFRYGADQKPEQEGTVSYAEFELGGQKFVVMDSAIEHDFSFNEAISLFVECQTQEEVDGYWEALSAVPEAEQCGWLKDKYGISWQIIPRQLGVLMRDPDPKKSGRVMEAMLKMKKIEIDKLEQAYFRD